MTHLDITDPWKYVHNLKTTERLGLYASDEAFTISSTSRSAVVVILQEKKGYLNLY
jgi:hypothetical protein